MTTATVSYKAELSDLRTQLASITDITRAEARKMVSELSKSMRALEKAQARATSSAGSYSGAVATAAKSSQGLSRAAHSVAVQLPDVASQLAAGAPASQVFVQQGLQVVQVNMAAVTTAAKAAGTALAGPFGLALAGAIALGSSFAGAYQEAGLELRATRAAIDDTYQAMRPEVIEAATRARRELNTVVSDSRQLLLLEMGELTSLDLQQMKAVQTARDSSRAILMEASARWARLEVQRQELKAAVESGDLDTKAELGARLRLDALRKELPAAKEKLDALKAETEAKVEGINATYNEVAAIRAAAKEKADAARVTGGGGSGADDAAAQREAAQAARERAAAAEELGRIQQAATLAVLDPQARLTEEYRRQMVAIGELQAASGDFAAAEQARAATREEYELELWQLRRDRARQEADDEKRLSQEVAQARLRHEQQVTQARQKAADNWMQATQVATQALAQSFEEGSAAALAFYTVSQAVAAAQAIVHGIQASMAALAPPPLGLGPVAGIPLAASTKALGIAQAAAIMGTTVAGFADTPGLQRAGPGGMTASFVPGDLVVAGRDEGDLVRQMQRAGIGMGGGSQVLIRDTDRHHGRYGRDPMRAPDRYQPVRRRAGRVPGRR